MRAPGCLNSPWPPGPWKKRVKDEARELSNLLMVADLVKNQDSDHSGLTPETICWLKGHRSGFDMLGIRDLGGTFSN